MEAELAEAHQHIAFLTGQMATGKRSGVGGFAEEDKRSGEGGPNDEPPSESEPKVPLLPADQPSENRSSPKRLPERLSAITQPEMPDVDFKSKVPHLHQK